jgi:hypothetical protein
VALCAALPVLWLALTLAGPASAQTNSPSGGQNTGQAPAQGGNSGEGGGGGDGQSGNRTTPGGGGATGGGSSGAGAQDTGDSSGSTGIIVGVLALLVIGGIALAITSRHRRVMDDADTPTPSAAR